MRDAAKRPGLTKQETQAVVLALRTALEDEGLEDKWRRAMHRVLAKLGVTP